MTDRTRTVALDAESGPVLRQLAADVLARAAHYSEVDPDVLRVAEQGDGTWLLTWRVGRTLVLLRALRWVETENDWARAGLLALVKKGEGSSEPANWRTLGRASEEVDRV